MAENLITKIKRKNDSSSSSEFNIGTFFENVLHTTDNEPDFSLNDFYNHYANFINNGTFMMYSEKEPKEDQVKIWWQIWEDTTGPISANSRVSLSQTEIEVMSEGIVQTIENFIFPIYVEIPTDYSVDDIQGIHLFHYMPPDMESIGSFAINAVEWTQDLSDSRYIKVELKEDSKWDSDGTNILNDGSTIRITYSSNG